MVRGPYYHGGNDLNGPERRDHANSGRAAYFGVLAVR